MIFFDRYREDENGNVIEPNQEWFTAAATLTAQAMEEEDDHVVTDHYKHAEVKMALEKLFYDKCAYCESRPTPSGPWDVEHYRPKGEVAESESHPGYYWLAYDWENLYPSCVSCNRRLRDPARYDDPNTLGAEGKLTQFPVETEASRATSHLEDIEQEVPLLLDPNIDDPELHLTYDIQGQIVPIDDDDYFATQTIKICHLKRRRLRDDRARTIIRVREIVSLLETAQSNGEQFAVEALNTILDTFVADDAIYAGAARAVVIDPKSFLTE